MGINAFIDLRPELLPDELPYSVELQVLARPLCPRFCAAAIRPTLCALGTVPHGGQSERQVERVAPALRGISLPRACSSTEAQGIPGETPPLITLKNTTRENAARGRRSRRCGAKYPCLKMWAASAHRRCGSIVRRSFCCRRRRGSSARSPRPRPRISPPRRGCGSGARGWNGRR